MHLHRLDCNILYRQILNSQIQQLACRSKKLIKSLVSSKRALAIIKTMFKQLLNSNVKNNTKRHRDNR